MSYDPTAINTDNDTLELTYFDGITVQNLDRDIEGEAVAVGLIVVSDGATFDYGDVAIGGQKDHTFTLDNTCLLYTSPSPRDQRGSRMPSSA